MVRKSARSVGRQAEQLVERYLSEQGLCTIARNFYCRMGEIDLVMRDTDFLVFVEVRFRSANRLTSARSTVDGRKRQRLIKTAAMYLAANPRYANCVMRFDIVGVDRNSDGSQRIHWVRDAFRPTNSSL